MFQDITQGPGQAGATTYTIEILMMLLAAFVLGLLLGYILWYRWRKLYAELQTEHERLKAQHLELEKEHASLNYKLEQAEKERDDYHRKVMRLEGDVATLKYRLEKSTAEIAAFAAVGTAAAAAPVVRDDLKVIEGVGPKIEELCYAAGIYSYAQLAGTSEDELRKMLNAAGPAFRMSDPGTWSRQAELAAAGKWDELKEYQDILTGGKNPEIS